MFSTKDLEQIEAKGIEVQTVESQIQYFVNGFPWMNLTRAATPKDGILQLSDEQIQAALDTYETYVPTLRIVKFVPASGAATRMFKSLFGFLEGGKSDKSVDQFFERLPEFAFYDDLKAALAKDGLDIETADQQTIAEYFLTGKGLDYGSLPKGLLKFHRYADPAYGSAGATHRDAGAACNGGSHALDGSARVFTHAGHCDAAADAEHRGRKPDTGRDSRDGGECRRGCGCWLVAADRRLACARRGRCVVVVASASRCGRRDCCDRAGGGASAGAGTRHRR